MIFIVDFGSKKTPEIASCLSALGQLSKVISWSEAENTDWPNATAIILSGAPVLLTEIDTQIYLKPFDFLKRIETPILGICFGHQLIGMLHGAKIFKGDEVRTEIEIFINKQDPLFYGFNESVKMVQDHTEGISLPQSFITLASSEKYEVEAMKHSAKKLYGVQFHPEVSGESGLKLLGNFCRMI